MLSASARATIAKYKRARDDEPARNSYARAIRAKVAEQIRAATEHVSDVEAGSSSSTSDDEREVEPAEIAGQRPIPRLRSSRSESPVDAEADSPAAVSTSPKRRVRGLAAATLAKRPAVITATGTIRAIAREHHVHVGLVAKWRREAGIEPSADQILYGRRHSPELLARAVELVALGQSVASVSRLLGISRAIITKHVRARS